MNELSLWVSWTKPGLKSKASTVSYANQYIHSIRLTVLSNYLTQLPLKDVVLVLIQKLNPAKATGLDNISCRLLKEAASIISDSLYVQSSMLLLLAVSFQMTGSVLKHFPFTRKMKEITLIITVLFPLYLPQLKFLRESYIINSIIT